MEELDLKELFSIFWNKRLEIILITLIFIVIGIGYSYFFITPEYKAVTSLVLAQSSSSGTQAGDGAITTTDITMNSKLISTYSELIKRNTVLDQVATNLNISEQEIEVIKKKISVSAVSDTDILEIAVENQDPNYATKITNEIAKVFREKMEERYKISNIYLVDAAEVPTTPSNINHMKDVVIFAFIGLVISAGYVLVANMLDNTVKTEEDVEKSTGLIVLSSIPLYDVELKVRRGGRR